MSLVSVVIPTRNEGNNIRSTVEGIQREFNQNKIDYEILIINDGSEDNTADVTAEMIKSDKRVRLVDNHPPHGIGNAIRRGLKAFKGDCVIIAMADASDDPRDMITYINVIKNGSDCCFGNRWTKEAAVENYPPFKQFINRFVNWWICVFFGIRYKDVTNAFKCYSKETINGIKPILSHHFNITVELPLKAIIRGYSYKVVPTNWRGRKVGKSSLKLEEMGSRYLFITLYCWFEKLLSKGDYKKK